MAFHSFTTKRVSCFIQYDRIDDLIACKLRGNKCSILRKFLVDEFYFSAVFKCLDPLFIWHFCTSAAQINVSQSLSVVFFYAPARSEEHTSELQSHSFISYAVFCLKK